MNARTRVLTRVIPSLASAATYRGIYLSNNQLQGVPAGLFAHNTALTRIFLHTNQLQAVPAGLFDQNTALQVLDLWASSGSTGPSDNPDLACLPMTAAQKAAIAYYWGPEALCSCCVYGFTTRAIGQSTPVASANNTLSATLAPYHALAGGDTVTISGLTGSQTPSGSLALRAGSCGDKLGSQGAWTQGAGQLVLTVGAGGLAAGASCVVGFDLVNPAVAQASPAVSIEADAAVDAHDVGREAMSKNGSALYGVANGTDPLTVVVPTFSTKAIGQSTPASGATNTITVSLAANIDLAAGASATSVTITGLTGSATSTTSSLALATAACDTFGATGDWHSDGTLTLTLAATLAANTECVISFALTNPSAAQASPAVSVGAALTDGSASIGAIAAAAMSKPGTAVYGVANGTDPLLVVVVSACTVDSAVLPCSFGGCIFSLVQDNVLQRNGTCAGQAGDLYLNSRGIKTVPADVFHNMGSLETIRLSSNQLQALPAGLFVNNTALTSIFLHSNQLQAVPAGLFDHNTALT